MRASSSFGSDEGAVELETALREVEGPPPYTRCFFGVGAMWGEAVRVRREGGRGEGERGERKRNLVDWGSRSNIRGEQSEDSTVERLCYGRKIEQQTTTTRGSSEEEICESDESIYYN